MNNYELDDLMIRIRDDQLGQILPPEDGLLTLDCLATFLSRKTRGSVLQI